MMLDFTERVTSLIGSLFCIKGDLLAVIHAVEIKADLAFIECFYDMALLSPYRLDLGVRLMDQRLLPHPIDVVALDDEGFEVLAPILDARGHSFTSNK